MSKPLRLKAVDPDDLQVIAACLQDALIPLGEMAFMPEHQCFLASFNRFQRERIEMPEETSENKSILTLCQSVLRVDRVQDVKYRGVDRDLDAIKFELLTILAKPIDAGGHHLVLLFAGDVAIRLRVSELSLTLQDFGAPWEANVTPSHNLIDLHDRPTGKS